MNAYEDKMKETHKFKTKIQDAVLTIMDTSAVIQFLYYKYL